MAGAWPTDAARGAGYAGVAWPALAYSFGLPAPWILSTTFLLGVALLGYGIAAEMRQRGKVAFVLNKPQSAWFVGGTAAFWVTIALLAPFGGTAGQSCTQTFEWVDAGSTKLSVDLRVPPGIDGVLARVGGFAQGNVSFQAPSGTNQLLVATVEDVTFGVEYLVNGNWEGVGGGAVENGSHQFGYNKDFGAEQLRLVATAPGSRDGTTQQADLRFLRQQSQWTCTTT